jgi:two-component system CheB/CheR fusion protein
MPVVEATEGMRVEANRVYIIPPNKYMTIQGGVLRLTGPVERRGPHTSIDLFLRSLADDLHEKAICVILSGTGSHGALGLKAVKAAGGMAMVQDPATADYDRMPLSAVATGLADYVLPVDQMGEALIRYAQHSYINGGASSAEVTEAPDHFHRLLALLHARTRFDFRYYRKKMLARRVERRMGLSHFNDLGDYIGYLREHPDELKQLARDLLISVTSFFRDPEAYRALQAEVVAPLVQDKQADQPIRVWVPGCATGEEAYSIGMLMFEQLANAKKSCNLQIFATDVDDESLETARQAIYSESIAADVSPERLDRFFIRADETAFQVNKQLRESAIFAVQNLIADPPFSKLDLISCRNVLIYLEPHVQAKVISLLHFALNEGGYLFLGPSETIGRQIDLFEPISKKWRIYKRIGPSRPDRVEFPIISKIRPRPKLEAGGEEAQPGGHIGFAEFTQKLLLDQFAPAAVLVNRKYEVLYFFGPTMRYLDVPTGEPTVDVIAMARDELRSKLRWAIHRVAHDGEPLATADAEVKRNGGVFRVLAAVKRALSPGVPDGLLLVTFQDVSDEPLPPREQYDTSDERLVRQLEYELKATKEDLQSTIEELESSNEELKASNEEVMSMNEELQSANEELETSKEELQSLNEELSTVNNQLQEKVDELEGASNDLANLLNCTNIATVFLDTDFRIKRFTPATTRLLKLIATDVGRPIADIAPRFTDPELLRDAEFVLRELRPRDLEVPADDGTWWIRRTSLYRTLDNRIAGVVLTFYDITLQKQAGEILTKEVEKRTAELAASKKELVEVAAIEQQRIGEDLHDNVGQELTALSLLSDGLIESAEAHAPIELELAKKLRSGLRRVLGQVRAISRGMIPFEVEAHGLSGALEELAERLSEGYDIPCRFRGDPRADIKDRFKARHLFLIAQEACTNAVKHGQASRIDISLEAPDQHIVLKIQDDGAGMPWPPPEGLGLRIMRNRANVLQGRLAIERAKPQGTIIACTIPKEPSDATSGTEDESGAGAHRG